MKTDEILSLDEVAEILKISVKTVRRRIASGKIRFFKEGGRIRVLNSELDKYVSGLIQKGGKA